MATRLGISLLYYVVVFTTFIPYIYSQILIGSDRNLICPKSTLKLKFCVDGPIMLICNKINVVVEGYANCGDRLAGVYPGGIKDSASCWQPLNPVEDGSAACSWNGKVYPDDGPAFPLPEGYTHIGPNYTCLPSAASYYVGKTNIEELLTSTVPCPGKSARSSSPASQLTTSLPRNISTQNHNYNQSFITTSLAQTKSLDRNIAFPPFVLLSTNPSSECDLSGPLCQTGSIVAEVELIGTTTTRTVPCSDYLHAQSAYFRSQNDQKQASGLDLFESFRRSPQCTSIANDHSPAKCDPSLNLTSVDIWNNYLPYGVNNISYPISCCGYCQMMIPEVQVFSWDTDVVGNCSLYTKITTSESSINTSRDSGVHFLQKRNDSLSGSTAVIDGYTFTSPSIYLVITGTAVVSDYCGQVGPEYTGLTIAIPSGGLSTLSYDVPVGGSVRDISEGYTKRLDPRDLHCPKWGVEKPNGGLGGWKVGPPFMPIILAPPELQSLNTDWARCTYPTDRGWIVTYGIFDPPRFLTPAGPDLIQSLTPVAETVVTTSQTPKSTGREAQPASQISGSAAKTTHSNAVHPFPTPLPDSDRSATEIPDPIKTAPTSVSKAAPKKHDASSHGAVDDPSHGDPDAFDPLDPDRPNPTKQDTSDPAGVDILKLIDPTRSDSLDPDRPNPTKQDISDPAGVDILKLIDPTRSDSLDPNRHGSIHPDSHLKKPQVVSPSDSNREPFVGANGPQTTIDIDGVMYTAFEQVKPSEVRHSQAAQSKDGGNEASIGGNGHFTTVNIGGITYSAFGEDKPVQKNGAKELGGEMGLESKGPRTTVNLGEIIFGAFGGHTSRVQPSVITIGGSKITVRPSGLFIDGTALSEGDLPTTIAGTPILIDSSGIMIGSERVIFTPADPIITGKPTPLDSPGSLIGPDLGGPVSPDPVITEEGQIITVINPSAIAVNGITLSANAPATTISGVVYTIDSSGELVMNDPNTDLSAAGTLALVSSIITVDGLAITEEPDRIMVGGSTLTPGGSSVIISGTPIRLGTSGVLVVGTHSIDMPQITLPPALVSSTLNFGGLKITEKADQVIVGGLTLTPGGSAVTISGTSISLGSRGNLVVGTSTVDLTKESSPIISSQGITTANGNKPIEDSGAPKELYSLNPWKLFLWLYLGVQIIR